MASAQLRELLQLLHIGSEAGVKDFLHDLSRDGPSALSSVINCKDHDGRTALIHCARLGQTGCMKLVLEHGCADVHYNNPAPYGSGHEDVTSHGTALHEACIRGHEDCSSLLISHGASPFVCNVFGATAFDCALDNKKTPRSMISKLKELALCSVNLKAKCCMHVGTLNYPSYKACQAVVTPYQADDREMKRVYLFTEGSHKAKAVITYEAAEASIHGQDISLKIRDPEGTAVHLPGEEAMVSRQKWLAHFWGGFVSPFVLYIAGPPVVWGAQALYTGISDSHFHLNYDGRKCYKDLPDPSRNEVPPPLHTTVHFSASSLPQAERQAFINSVRGPNNAFMERLSPLEETLYGRHAPGQGSSQGTDEPLPILPSVPSSVRQRTHEQVCVVCLNEPSNLGLVHEDSMHICLCKKCIHLISRGKPCPMCRQGVEGIAAVQPRV